MNVRRPEERVSGEGAPTAEVLAYVQMAKLAHDSPSSRSELRPFYRVAPWLYTEAQRGKVRSSGQSQDAFDTAARCGASADQAAQVGFDEEAGALYVTAARLAHRAFSLETTYRNSPSSPAEQRRALLHAFAGLGAVRALPADDEAYWQDRLAEAAAALFALVAAFPFEGPDQIEAARAAGADAEAVRPRAPRSHLRLEATAETHPCSRCSESRSSWPASSPGSIRSSSSPRRRSSPGSRPG